MHPARRAWIAPLLAGALLATPAAAPAAPRDGKPSISGDGRLVASDATRTASARRARARGDAAKARRFLGGRRFSTFRSIDGDPPSSIERHYDFCRGGRIRYESTFENTALEEPAIDIQTGRWRVARARLSKRGFGTVRLRVVADSGTAGPIVITATRRGFRLDGQVAEVTRSPVCER